MWNLPAPPGFQGLRDDLPLETYTRNLPHWRQAGATYFVTYRLCDSLPQSKVHELRRFKADWEARHPPSWSSEALDDLARETMQRVEDWLDQGMGECLMRDHFIRDEEHLYRAIQYIGRNPAKAGLDPNACRRWIRPSWVELGWQFEETQSSPS